MINIVYIYVEVCKCDMTFPGLADDKQALAQHDVLTAGSFAQKGAKLHDGVQDSTVRAGVDHNARAKPPSLHERRRVLEGTVFDTWAIVKQIV